MKKLFLLIACLLTVFPLQCGERALMDVDASFLRIQKSILEEITLPQWAAYVKYSAREAQIDGGIIQYARKKFPLPVPQESVLTKNEQKIFDERANVLQKLLQKHPLLTYYTLSVPRNTDLVTLSKSQMRLVTGFLRQPLHRARVNERYQKVPVELYQHYIVKITLPEDVFLFVDCFHKKVHLVNKELNLENLPTAQTGPKDEFITK